VLMQRLTDLAARGMAEVPPAEFGPLAESCRSAMLNTGEARYAVLADMFRGLDAWWGEQGVPTPIASEIDRLLMGQLRAVLETTGTEGMRLAELLRLDIEQNELSEDEWFRRGYVRRSNA